MIVQIHEDGSVVVGATRINTARYSDPYAAAFDQLAQEARRRGSRVLTHGIDHTIGEDTWFYVSATGETEATSEPEKPRSAASGEDQPSTEGVSETVPVPPVPSTPPAVRQSKPERAHLQGPAKAHLPEPAGAPEPVSLERSPGPMSSKRASTQPARLDSASAPEPTETRASRRMEPTAFVKPTKTRPSGGLRGAMYSVSGGTINLGPSARQQQDDALARRISRQLPGAFNTAVLSLKGGIGKTSTTVGVGMTLAEFRGDLPCAIDANPDSGDLAERALGESIYQSSSPRTVSDIIDDFDSITSLTELSRYMQHAGRFHVLAGEQDPEVSDSLTAEEYLKIRTLIGKYYSVLLTDCGTGVTHNAMSGILQSADNLVIAAGYAVSGAKRARSTLLWLAGHGYEELARNAIVVITDKDGVSSRVNKAAISEHLSGICRELIAVPHDQGVADGDLISLSALRPATRRAYREIAAAIVDGYQ